MNFVPHDVVQVLNMVNQFLKQYPKVQVEMELTSRRVDVLHDDIDLAIRTNFTANEVKTWCGKMGIKLDYASVYHPQTNGQVERANGLIMSGIKPRLVRSLTKSDTH